MPIVPRTDMNLQVFRSLPDEARVWVYAFDRPLTEAERRMVGERLEAFMREWHSHNADVEGSFTLAYDQFVIISGASRDGLSGCSIDSSVENFKFFRDEHGLDALNRASVHYRDSDGAVRALTRDRFKSEVDDGRCGAATTVFDLTVQTLGDVRAGRLEVPLADAWHAKVFLPA